MAEMAGKLSPVLRASSTRGDGPWRRKTSTRRPRFDPRATPEARLGGSGCSSMCLFNSLGEINQRVKTAEYRFIVPHIPSALEEAGENSLDGGFVSA
jgi:hypothetical protein